MFPSRSVSGNKAPTAESILSGQSDELYTPISGVERKDRFDILGVD